MREFIVPSGEKVAINAADWVDAKALKKAIMTTAAAVGIKLDLQADVSELVKIVLALEGSDAVDAALARCLIRCTRDGEKITDATFNDTEARKDYYEIVIACVQENLGPLFESAFSKFTALAASTKAPSSPA